MQSRKKIATPLALLLQQINCAAIARAVDAQLSLGTGWRGGYPAWPTVLMIQLLLLQQFYKVSDDALKYLLLELHISTDRRWGLIRRHSVSGAHVHDSQQLDALLDPSYTGRSVWADSADAKRQRLAEAGLEQ